LTLLAHASFGCRCDINVLFDDNVVVTEPQHLYNLKASALVLWGGEDISPGIYKQRPSRETWAEKTMSVRDFIEVSLVKTALKMDIPIIGICRGAQLMCALSGGTVIQHVDGHAGWRHNIVTKDGAILVTNSYHHQMMNPFKVDHAELIAWAEDNLSKVYVGDADEPVKLPRGFREPEVVWFPNTKSLCIQGHPEFEDASSSFINYSVDLCKEYIIPNVKDK
jgi:GMP synthase-like glutamine amidotransferase